MEFLLGMLMFLTGWFVCWIQMSKSENQEIAWFENQHNSVMLQYLKWQSENQKLKSENQGRLKALKSRQAEKSELKSQIRELTTRLMFADHRLWEYESEYQSLLAESAQLRNQKHLLESQILQPKSPSPVSAEFEYQLWKPGHLEVAHPDSNEETSQ